MPSVQTKSAPCIAGRRASWVHAITRDIRIEVNCIDCIAMMGTISSNSQAALLAIAFARAQVEHASSWSVCHLLQQPCLPCTACMAAVASGTGTSCWRAQMKHGQLRRVHCWAFQSGLSLASWVAATWNWQPCLRLGATSAAGGGAGVCAVPAVRLALHLLLPASCTASLGSLGAGDQACTCVGASDRSHACACRYRKLQGLRRGSALSLLSV